MQAAHALPGKATSIWMDTAPHTTYPALAESVAVDVCVIGGGITGIAAALELREAGCTVALVEMHRVATGVTGYTTAKVTALHGSAYRELRSRHGADGARAYAQANTAALAWIAARAQAIDCDFRRKSAFTYAEEVEDLPRVEQEIAAARDAGLGAVYTEEVDLPWSIAGAVRLDDQAEFHPRRFALALAGAIAGDGSYVFERTRALEVAGGSPCRIETDRGDIRAGHVLVCTHYPFLDRGLFFARCTPERSYALGVRLDGRAPQGMYISTERPSHSVRSTSDGEGGEVVLVGGQGHKTGQGGDVATRYRALEHFARARFEVREVVYRWGAQDVMPADGLPYVGAVLPRQDRILTATGYRKWGMTNGVAAALMLRDRVLGRENPWASHFDSNRITPLASARKLITENVNVALHFFADRLASPDVPTPDFLDVGEGGIVSIGGRRVAASRDEHGTLHAVSPVCTHLGCEVRWNSGDRSWDCPCHGSRYAPDGTVIEGPATRDLPPEDLHELGEA